MVKKIPPVVVFITQLRQQVQSRSNVFSIVRWTNLDSWSSRKLEHLESDGK
jgi:hypothetical protein